ncbi:MAG: 2-oxo acid dehydrogenase subunit E2 [Chloroflexi bacterium]|nr:MAG: 2-oxo acid dehydrogenase subunit E2 [Chloroflexota bacterium]
MATKVIMPQLGESVVEGTVTTWLKKEGETIAEFESLLEINTDKVDTEIPSPAGGTILKIIVPEGQTVTAGTILAWIGEPGEVLPASLAEPVEARPADTLRQAQDIALPQARPQGALRAGTEPPLAEPVEARPVDTSTSSATAPVAAARDLGFISPVVARLAADKKVDLTRVKGTGQGGRITKKDVLDYLEKGEKAEPAAVAAPWETPGEGDLFRPTELQFGTEKPQAEAPGLRQAQPTAPVQPVAPVQPAKGGEQLIPHTTMRKRIAEHMVNSKHTSPHVTTVMESDFKRVAAHYAKNKDAFARDGVKLTYTAYFAAATAAALRAFPLVNSSWSDEGVIIHPQVNLAIAVSLGAEGLIVPVIPNADGLSLLGLARAINDIATRARAHRLNPDEVRGGTFSITNHGTSGSLFATPVINQPQCAILGVGAVQKRAVVVEGDAIAVRPMVYLSLTFDHRILDGASADGFLAKVVEVLNNWPD